MINHKNEENKTIYKVVRKTVSRLVAKFFFCFSCVYYVRYLIFSKSRGCNQNNLAENTRNTYRVDLFTSQLFPWIHYSIYGKEEDFSKRVDSLWKKRRIDPTLLYNKWTNFSNTYTCGFTKRMRNLRSAFEKAASHGNKYSIAA